MQCPIDGATLVMTERSGVEIDYCPKCRGVWLDRGELDKIIEKSGAAAISPAVVVPPAPPMAPGPSQSRPVELREPERPRRGYSNDDDDDDRPRRRRRESFLSELFDF